MKGDRHFQHLLGLGEVGDAAQKLGAWGSGGFRRPETSALFSGISHWYTHSHIHVSTHTHTHTSIHMHTLT